MVEETAVSKGAEANQELTPWEQHSAVISLPRFDYKAPSSLLENSHSGFLITCTIKREKSASKEAISMLDKYVRSLPSHGSEKLKSSDVNVAAKKRKICLEKIEAEGEDTNCSEDGNSVRETGNPGEGQNKSVKVPMEETQNACGSSAALSLVKLTRSGLILFTWKNSCTQTADIMSDILGSLNLGSLRAPQWCHRILPIQATCSLKEDNIREVVSKLVQQFLEDKRHKHEKPIKFAVAYNKRGIDVTEMKSQKTSEKDSNGVTLLDRNQCFTVVAKAVKDIVEESVVDLTSPELVVFVELLPLSGLPQGTLIAAVSVLPQNLITTKPRITVKPLISEPKTKKQN
ncbi:hypothetical protein H6P81_018303 [Aristolochia fimbriata]|uniref:THUMP domain-containing protein n=1 Tax=Aristolochia fimbriata TaxID=158543 RepID=A0AAV7E2J8_ARIFI|nr:hypothetical protein H6P81_018303 [Aristolochia fimbriata]